MNKRKVNREIYSDAKKFQFFEKKSEFHVQKVDDTLATGKKKIATNANKTTKFNRRRGTASKSD